MNIIRISDISQPELAVYSQLTERQLRNNLHPDEALIVVVSPKVIRTALDAGLVPLSLLCEEKHITGDAREIAQAMGDACIYTGTREVLSQLTGYTLTRGVLCAMKLSRPSKPS